jgi:hypothetical protein
LSLAFDKAGRIIAASIAIIATTTSNSINVKAMLLLRCSHAVRFLEQL